MLAQQSVVLVVPMEMQGLAAIMKAMGIYALELAVMLAMPFHLFLVLQR